MVLPVFEVVVMVVIVAGVVLADVVVETLGTCVEESSATEVAETSVRKFLRSNV